MTHRNPLGLLANPHRFLTLLVPELGANCADPRTGSSCGSKSFIGPSEHCGKSVHVLHRFPLFDLLYQVSATNFRCVSRLKYIWWFEWNKNFIARTARISVSGSQGGSSPSLEDVDCFQATGSRFQGSSEEIRNTRRRLDTDKSRDDENARSAVLTTRYLTRLTSRQRVHCFETCLIQEPNVQFSWTCAQKDGLFFPVRSPFVMPESTTLVRQLESSEWQETGRRFALQWKCRLQSYKKFTLWKALKVHTLFQPLISAHKCSAQRV